VQSAADGAVIRCAWATSDPLHLAYHDEEWGVPLHDDRALFELLTLEGAQAGLSWLTILRKREGYRRAFDNFVADIVAGYDDRKVEALMGDAGIVRNRAKIRATINNAARVIAVLLIMGWKVAGSTGLRRWQKCRRARRNPMR